MPAFHCKVEESDLASLSFFPAAKFLQGKWCPHVHPHCLQALPLQAPGQPPVSLLQLFKCKRIMLRLLVTFSFPCLLIKQLLVPFLQTEPTESSRVCVCLAEEKEKEECHKGNGLLQTQMITPLVCDLGFNMQLSPLKKPPGGKKKLSGVDQVIC